MNSEQKEKLSLLLQVLGSTEEPMGIFYSDETPTDGFSPEPWICQPGKKNRKTKSTGKPFLADIPVL